MTNFEGGQRVPTVMRWPGKIPAGTACSEIASTIDVLPTLAAITGADLPADRKLDGKNIIDLMTGKPEAKSPHDMFFFVTNAVRAGDWKYHKRETFKLKSTARKTNGPSLYNLKDDIGESKNLIQQHPEIAERLRKALEAHVAYLKEQP